MNEKMIFGMFVIAIVAIIQGMAWIIGYDGAVFAFTSLIIGAVAGSILGFNVGRKPTTTATSPTTEEASIMPVKK